MKVGAVVALSIGLLVGCAGKPVAPPVGALEAEGFEAFATPRSFDGPGTIFRIDGEKKRFPVTEIIFKVQDGTEEIPKASSSRVLSLSQFLEALGASAVQMPASVKANLSRTTTTNIESTTAKRRFVRDDEVVTTLRNWATQARPAGDSVYYLIRETVSTPSLVYKVDRNWLASLNLDVKALKAAGYTGEAKASSGDTLEMNRTFAEPLNVWFKAERIVIKPALGAGPGQYTIERAPVSAAFLGL